MAFWEAFWEAFCEPLSHALLAFAFAISPSATAFAEQWLLLESRPGY
jgi:hypothetical protein